MPSTTTALVHEPTGESPADSTQTARGPKVLTDPGVISAVLADAKRTSVVAAAGRAGYGVTTVYRWKHHAEQNPGWPSEADRAAWLANEREQQRPRDYARQSRKRRAVAGRPLLVDPTGTERRIQALLKLGWTNEDIAARSGMQPKEIGLLASGRRQAVYQSTQQAVSQAFGQMWMIRPTGWIHDRQRRAVEDLGYQSALAWDNIDDPTERPNRAGLSRTDQRICELAASGAAAAFNTTAGAVLDGSAPSDARAMAMVAANRNGVSRRAVDDYFDGYHGSARHGARLVSRSPQLASAAERLSQQVADIIAAPARPAATRADLSPATDRLRHEQARPQPATAAAPHPAAR